MQKKYLKLSAFLLVFFIAAMAVAGLYIYKPKTKKIIPKRPVPLVKTIAISPQSEKIVIGAFGTVMPAKQITLHSEVEGRVIEQSPELVPGGILKKGAFISQIDPLDYDLEVKERQAEVAEAQYELELEEGQQVIAKQEWQIFEQEDESFQASKSLALREPHLKFALAKLEAAKSRLAAAELAKKRTIIRAPFNALVLEEFIDKGQLVSRQTPIAALVNTDNFWVQVSIPVSKLSRITFPNGKNKTGSTARLVLNNDNGSPLIRNGSVFKLLGDLDPKGRMARVLITVNDPLDPEKGQILLGSYLEVEIDAGIMDNVYVIPRQAMRDRGHIWLISNNGQLSIRQTEIQWRRENELLVTAKISEGEKLITSRLQSPLPGMALKGVQAEN